MALSIFIGISCRGDDSVSKPKFEKLLFAERMKTISVGDTVTVGITGEPTDAKKYQTIGYKTTEQNIIEIKAASGNEGVIIEGLKRGKTVITASANGVVDYCEITVLGGDGSEIPHILLENYVYECRENDKKTITATLAGGTPLDNSGFSWSYSDQKVISVETANNVAVFDARNIGSSVITVSHPKAQFSADILVYVLGNDEIPLYITTDYNVIKLQANQSNYQFSVGLNGGGENDFYGFTMQVTDGKDVVDLRSNNNIGTINPQKKGTAKIRVSHPKAQYSTEIVVIVYEEIMYKYIDLNQTLVILEEGEESLVIADFVGEVPHDHDEKYTYKIEDETIVDIWQSYNRFSIRGLKRGKSTIKIHNEYADFEKEILVIVNGISSIYDREIYINTNQNVITTEVGADDVLLTMALIGGNEADRNNFIWTVDDGTVIDVISAHGKVNYINRAMTNVGDKFEAQAYIKAKKVGTARITLENPKAKHSFSVLVKVYKRGIFDLIPPVLDGSSLYQIEVGEKLTTTLNIVTGNVRDAVGLTWTSGNNGVLDVSGAGLTGILEGKNYGITTVKVQGPHLKHPYEAVVIVGDANYFASIPYMYVMNPYISVVKGETVSLGIVCDNMTSAQIADIAVINNDKNIIDAFGYRRNVTITGLELGDGEIVLKSTGVPDVVVKVRVEEPAINPDKPFYLRSNQEIYGMVKGQNVVVSVDLVGAAAHNERDLMWSIENSSVAGITENGKSCMVKGLSEGQTIITVKHTKSINPELKIVVYVVESENDLANKIIVYMKDSTLLMGSGESRYISVITNANDAQKRALSWNITGTDVIDYQISEDRIKAYIIAKNAGNAVISVNHVNVIIPAVTYISVINRGVMQQYIDVPSIVELVMGQNVTITAVAEGISASNVTWTVKDSSIISAFGNGLQCMVSPIKSGNTIITVEHSIIKYKKDILVYVYGSTAEMKESYLIAGEQTRYVINKGDTITVNLLFGMRGYPEHDQINIGWSAGANNVVGVEGNGRTATVIGKNAGIGTVTVVGKSNTIQIEIEVRDDLNHKGGYWFNIKSEDKVKGLLAGTTATIEVEIWNGNSKVLNINEIAFENENDSIVSVELNKLVLTVRAVAGKEGQSYITLKHSAVEDARILIYTAVSEFGLQNAYPLYIEKTNYLLSKGESVDIAVGTIDNNAAKYNNINYSLQNNNGIVRIAEKDKRTVMVEALSIGSDVVQVRYNTEVVQKIYVSVTENGLLLNAEYLITEGVIGLVMGTERETTVKTNASYVNWTSENRYIASIVRKEGNKAVIKGEYIGQTFIKVSSGSVERYLLVVVCETEEELNNYQAINIEQRYYQVRKNESVTIALHSLTGVVEGTTSYADNYNYNPQFGGVIKINKAENHQLSVMGVQEGVAALFISNPVYTQNFIVYVEVNNRSSGGVTDVESQNYITASKTMYVIGMYDRDVTITVFASGDNFRGDYLWAWQLENNDIVDMTYAGRSAFINPKKEGEVTLIVSNPYCVNSPFEILVIVGSRYEVDNSRLPYIDIEKDVYEMLDKGANLIIPYSLVNVADVVISQLTVTNYSSDIVSYRNDTARQELVIEPIKPGIARLVMWYQDLKREIYVLVKENINFGSVYLTTSENYVIMSVGEFRTVQTKLVGAEEYNVNNFKWTVDPAYGIVQVFGNGETGQLYALAASSTVAKVTVTYSGAPDFPLTIYVRVVADKTQVNMAYLTTQQNVIDMIAGSASETVSIQKIGNFGFNDRILWRDYDSTIISVESHDTYASITPQKDGITRIRVYLENNNAIKLDIIIVVRPSLGNGVYIDASETLIIMKPNDTPRRIQASLVNGNTKDNTKFRWEKYGQDVQNSEVALAGGNVISLLDNNEECVINALYEGIARIKISNSQAERPLIITVYVTQYESIAFENKARSMLCGEVTVVSLNLPTYENMAGRVVLQSSDTSHDIIEVYHTNTTVFVKANSNGNEGAVILTAYIRGQEDKVAEMAINVTKNDPPNTNKIVVDRQMLNFSTKSDSIILNASISGPNIAETEKDKIKWKITQSPQKGSDGVIAVLPATCEGRQIRVSPVGTGEATITVWHTLVEESYWKTIKITIDDLNNKFSLSVNKIEIRNMTPETITAEIVGGQTKDYNEIKWIAMPQQRWDGTMLEIVRIMGSGKQVLLYPMNDGSTKVIAYYNGKPYELDVEVVNEYYFDFKTGTEYMFPGETREITYEIRPVSSNVTWVKTGMGHDEPVIVYADVMGSPTVVNNTSIRKLFIEAIGEGTQTIVGMANGHVATLTVIVDYDYSFKMDNLNAISYQKNVMGFPKPKYPPNSSNPQYDGYSEVRYWIYPPNTYIELDEKTSLPDGLNMVIYPFDKDVGYGLITFNSAKELSATLTFNQFKVKKAGETKGVATGEDPYTISVAYEFGFGNIEPVFKFVHGDGAWSKAELNPGQTETWTKSNGGMTYTYNGTVTIGDGEEHYLLITPNITTAQFHLGKPNALIDDGITDNINLYYPFSEKNNKFNSVFSVDKTEINVDGTVQAVVRLSGGNDYMVHDRVMFDKNLFLYIQTSPQNIDGSIDVPVSEELSPMYVHSQGMWVTTEKPCIKGNWDRIIDYDEYYRGYYVSGLTVNGIPVGFSVPAGSEETKEYYLLKNESIDKMGAFISKASECGLIVWLHNYWDDYRYFFTGDEVPDVAFKSLINNTDICMKVKVYRPYTFYDYGGVDNSIPDNLQYELTFRDGVPIILLAHQFKEYIDKDNPAFGVTKNYALSPRVIDHRTETETVGEVIKVYVYEKEMYDNLEAIQGEEDDASKYIKSLFPPYGRFVTGRYDEAKMLREITPESYQNKNSYVYSTVEYLENVAKFDANMALLGEDDNTPLANNVESQYNLLTRQTLKSGLLLETVEPSVIRKNFVYNQNDYNKIDDYGYQRNHILQFYEWNSSINKFSDREAPHYIEHFYYKNQKYAPIIGESGKYPLFVNDADGKKRGFCIIDGNKNSDSKDDKIMNSASSVVEIIKGYERVNIPNAGWQEVPVTKRIYHSIPKNPQGINIFGRSGTTVVYGNGSPTLGWSGYYRMSRPHGEWYNFNNDYNSYYALEGARHKLQWEDAGNDKPIIPYYYFNQYPFKYVMDPKKQNPNRIGDFNAYYQPKTVLIKYTDGNSNARPMPSVDTQEVSQGRLNTVELELKYYLFDKYNGIYQNTPVITVIIPIRYEVRKSSMNYRPESNQLIDGKIHIQGYDVNNKSTDNPKDRIYETVGHYSSFTEYKNDMTNLDATDERKKAYDLMSEFFQ
jgi:hypothetical protein